MGSIQNSALKEEIGQDTLHDSPSGAVHTILGLAEHGVGQIDADDMPRRGDGAYNTLTIASTKSSTLLSFPLPS